MQRLAKWHIWLGWLVGVPLVLWTLSGLVMALKPIEETRGEALRASPPLLREFGVDLVMPRVAPHDVISGMHLVQQADGPVWIVETEGGGTYRYSARDGSLVPPLIESEARAIAVASWGGDAALDSVTYLPADMSPPDLRARIDTWQAHFADGTNLYIRADSGEVLALRTGWWRFYDVMWGLHIMDLETREDTSHPILILFAALALAGSLLGCALLFRRRKARVSGGVKAS
ncbi:hypothetical protein [Alteraurantiacibacter buctensis]|nr:hypothetical protein [Alteraurantiacibacter buctensis]